MNVNVLAIDTSCDETSVAIVQNRKVLSSVRFSQVDLHKEYGGVVPMIARRAHQETIEGVFKEALKKSKLKIDEITHIAVTYGPGLAIDLEVGIEFAKHLAIKYSKPLIPINHMEGHLLSSLSLNSKGKGLVTDSMIKNMFPALGLLISGKHTELLVIEDFGKYTKIGQTLDDAAGEAFDKVGRMLNFGYPGGPVVSEFAKKGKLGNIILPIPLEKSKDLNFSYSGLKTACLYKLKELRESGASEKDLVYDFCRSFVESITRSLEIKLEQAISKYTNTKTVLVGGGVIQSEYILRRLGKLVKSHNLKYYYPNIEDRGDNAAMIGIAGYYNVLRNNFLTNREDILKLDRNPRLSL